MRKEDTTPHKQLAGIPDSIRQLIGFIANLPSAKTGTQAAIEMAIASGMPPEPNVLANVQATIEYGIAIFLTEWMQRPEDLQALITYTRSQPEFAAVLQAQSAEEPLVRLS